MKCDCFMQRWIIVRKLTLHDPPLLLLVLAAVSLQVPCTNIASRARICMRLLSKCGKSRTHTLSHSRVTAHRATHFTSSVERHRREACRNVLRRGNTNLTDIYPTSDLNIFPSERRLFPRLISTFDWLID